MIYQMDWNKIMDTQIEEIKYGFNSYLTKDVLIDTSDGSIELNVYGSYVYGSYCKFIGQVYTKTAPLMVLDFVSELLEFDKVKDNMWERFNINCIEWIKKNGWKEARNISNHTKKLIVITI